MIDAPKHPGIPRILLVEDDVLVAMDLACMLEELGFAVLGPCHTAQEAETLLNSETPDFAVLDYNLRELTSEAVADHLTVTGVPFAFLTGHVSHHLPQRFHDCQLIQKPVSQSDVQALVRQVLSN